MCTTGIVSIEQFYDLLIRRSIELGVTLVTPSWRADGVFMFFEFENATQLSDMIAYVASLNRSFVVFHRVIDCSVEFHAMVFRT